MRKPISKHALRRAMERVQENGLLRWEEPTGTIVDRVWHELEKDAYHAGGRKKAAARGSSSKDGTSAPVVAAADAGPG